MAAITRHFTGALIIMRPGFSGVSLGVSLALLSVIGLAGELLIVKSLASTEAPDTIAIWQMIVFTPCSLIPALFVWRTPDIWQFILLAGTGLFDTFTQRCLARAYAAADATVLQPFDFTRLVFSALLGLIVFAEFPDIWT
jgi:drug/metabolite transporter (DMT)-like permease